MMELYEKFRAVPDTAKREIGAGRLKGKTDINPMWRIKVLTETFGPCGIGWKYKIIREWLENGANGEISAFMDIELYYKLDGEWSEAVPGTGGSAFVAKEKNGLYTSDECYKMALTDAISVACKALGIGADVYWGADKTKGIIDILNSYGVKGTFFLVGFWMDKYPEETKMIADAGFDIGNHSKNHYNMSKLSKDDVVYEIESVNEQIKNLTGITPKYFRPPFGDYNNTLLDVVEDKGMVGVQWTIDTLDWKGLSGAQIAERVLPKAKGGDIVLFHNNSDHVLDALPIVLEGLLNKGFKIVTLSELVMTENYKIDVNGVQHKDSAS